MTGRGSGGGGSGGPAGDDAGGPDGAAAGQGGGVRGRKLRQGPLAWTARLSRALRREGVPCSVADSLAAARALGHLDVGDALDVYFGLRSVLVSSPDHRGAFRRCFWRLWGRGQPAGADDGGPRDDARADGGRRTTEEAEGAGGREGARAARRGLVQRLRGGAPPEHDDAAREGPAGGGEAYSRVEALARRSFASLDEEEVREVDRALDRVLFRLATRRSRRRRPRARRGQVDVRRSLRGALRHDGELIRLARRARRVERPRVVLLCDVSGSMERYSRFLVRFLLAAGRGRHVEAFVFSTRLVHLTPRLATSRDLDGALDALSRHVPGWSGGTRIGECLEAFLQRHGRRLLGRRTVVVVLSDGLDRGDVPALERAMRGIRRRARRVVWLNPLLESPDYRPEARGMKAALPYVDDFAPGHSLEALYELDNLIRL